jgi:hypothetical protein
VKIGLKTAFEASQALQKWFAALEAKKHHFQPLNQAVDQ